MSDKVRAIPLIQFMFDEYNLKIKDKPTYIFEKFKDSGYEQPKRKPLPDGTLPMTDEEKYELCKMMGYENISEIFYDNKLHFKCFDKGWGIIVDVKAILYLANLFDLEV